MWNSLNKKSSKLFPCRLQIYDDLLSNFFLLQASLLASFLRINTCNSRCVEFDFAFFFIYRSWQSLFWCAEVNICSDDSTDSLNETKHAHQLDKLLESLLSDTSVWFKSPPPFLLISSGEELLMRVSKLNMVSHKLHFDIHCRTSIK